MKTTTLAMRLLAVVLAVTSTMGAALGADAWKASDLFTDSRWTFNPIGSGAGGEYSKNDAAKTITLKPSKWTKLAESEDGFVYYYTEINPETENFLFTATFTIDEAAADSGEVSDNQTGFGIIAVDDMLPNDSPSRYFNSAGVAVGRYIDYKNGNKMYNGIPGGRFVRGYTGALTDSSGRDYSESKPFDWNYHADYPTSYKFKKGDVYTFSLRRSDVGFHAIMGDKEAVFYDDENGKNPLLVQDGSKYYVGIFAARKIVVTVSNISFKTINPAVDEKFPPRPTEYVTRQIRFDAPTSSGSQFFTSAFTTNFSGSMSIRRKNGDVVVSDVPVTKDLRFEAGLDLAEGTNDFVAVFTPYAKDKQALRSFEELDSYKPMEHPFTVTHKQYGSGDNAVYVSPNGKPSGTGAKANPIDLHSAVEYAQPGQQIILLDGLYQPERAIIIARGNNGAPGDEIYLMGEPGTRPRLDMSKSKNGALVISGNYWYIRDLEIYNTRGMHNGVLIRGHYNVLENISSHDNQETGIQISGLQFETFDMWPSYNQVLSCESYNNVDVARNDADGFAAKLTVGEGNRFVNCISRHNVDDGYDLYAKSTTGVIGAVVIENCIAYANGKALTDKAEDLPGDGNGFKLGGESMPAEHVLRNCVSFNNFADGITSNWGPNCRVYDSISYNNAEKNVTLFTNAKQSDWDLAGVVSYKSGSDDEIKYKDQEPVDYAAKQVFLDGELGVRKVDAGWFESLELVEPSLDKDGNIVMGNFLRLRADSPAGAKPGLSKYPARKNISIKPGIEK